MWYTKQKVVKNPTLKLIKSTQVQTLCTGKATSLYRASCGSVASYNRDDLNLSFTVCAVTARKAIEVNIWAPLS